MIDIENQVFDTVATALRTAFIGIYVTGEYVATVPQFPAISLEEKDNAVYENTISSDDNENHASLMYEVNVWSNKASGRKAECKAIIAAVNGQMKAMGFTRTMRNPIPNPADPTVYRVVARYVAIADTNETLFRR